jgi:hypothetical protein
MVMILYTEGKRVDRVDRNRGNLIFCSTAMLVVIAFVGWMLTGAGTGSASPSYRQVTESVQEPYTIQVKLNTDEAVMLKPNPFTITIHQGQGQPVSGAMVDMSVYMPDMFCGTSTATATEIRPGIYQADGIPLMAGKSAAEIKVQVAGQTYTVVHPFLSVR